VYESSSSCLYVHDIAYTLETQGIIKYGHSRDTANIVHKIQKEDEQTKNTQHVELTRLETWMPKNTRAREAWESFTRLDHNQILVILFTFCGLLSPKTL
jgi:hypothetical protein